MKSVLFASLLLGPVGAFSGSVGVVDPAWVSGTPGGQEIPANAVWAGAEGNDQNYVCRASYMNGIHPGKLLAGHCNIEFAGQELVRDEFEVLTADTPSVSWVEDSIGYVPEGAFATGEENGSSLFTCRAEVNHLDSLDRGLHAGKLIATNCNIPYGGGAYLSSTYSILVIKLEDPVAVRGTRWVPARAPAMGTGFTADGRRPARPAGAAILLK